MAGPYDERPSVLNEPLPGPGKVRFPEGPKEYEGQRVDRLLERLRDVFPDVETRPHFDAGEKKIIFERVQDVEPILENNKRLRSIPQKSDWGRHIASVPNVIWEKWLNEEFSRGVDWVRMSASELREFENKLMAKKLADPDWAYLRTDK